MQATSNIAHDRQPIEQEGQHCGLVNLGNTCYANAALQCIYSIPSIRSAFFCIDAALSARPIISELQQLFLAMSFGPHARVDTSAIAKVLNLDAGVQQVSCHTNQRRSCFSRSPVQGQQGWHVSRPPLTAASGHTSARSPLGKNDTESTLLHLDAGAQIFS